MKVEEYSDEVFDLLDNGAVSLYLIFHLPICLFTERLALPLCFWTLQSLTYPGLCALAVVKYST